MTNKKKPPKPFLSASPPPDDSSPPRPKTNTDRVRDYLVDWHRIDPARWHTLAEIAEATGLTIGQTNGAVYGLVGILAVEPKLPSRAGRRKGGQAYRWKEPA